MKVQYDFKKEWPKIKKQLVDVSKEAMVLVKKGEGELIRFSKKGKLHLDMAALRLKKESLFPQIGKEYVNAKCPGTQTPKLRKLVAAVDKIDKDVKVLKRLIKLRESMADQAEKKPAKAKKTKRVKKVATE